VPAAHPLGGRRSGSSYNFTCISRAHHGVPSQAVELAFVHAIVVTPQSVRKRYGLSRDRGVAKRAGEWTKNLNLGCGKAVVGPVAHRESLQVD
jgi:hypothetical protein